MARTASPLRLLDPMGIDDADISALLGGEAGIRQHLLDPTARIDPLGARETDSSLLTMMRVMAPAAAATMPTLPCRGVLAADAESARCSAKACLPRWNRRTCSMR